MADVEATIFRYRNITRIQHSRVPPLGVPKNERCQAADVPRQRGLRGH